jgi:hypothetical protein
MKTDSMLREFLDRDDVFVYEEVCQLASENLMTIQCERRHLYSRVQDWDE